MTRMRRIYGLRKTLSRRDSGVRATHLGSRSVYMRRFLFACALLAAPLAAQAPAPAPTTMAAATAGLDKRDGYFPIYWDSTKGRVLIEIPAGRLSQDFLF